MAHFIRRLRDEFRNNLEILKAHQAEARGQKAWLMPEVVLNVPEGEYLLVFTLRQRYVAHIEGLTYQDCKSEVMNMYNQLTQAREKGFYILLLPNGKEFDDTGVAFTQGRDHCYYTALEL